MLAYAALAAGDPRSEALAAGGRVAGSGVPGNGVDAGPRIPLQGAYGRWRERASSPRRRGLATTAALLLFARTAQGVAAALAAPSTFALIKTAFDKGPELASRAQRLLRRRGGWRPSGWSSEAF
jgi:hypothetical protein